MTRQLTWKLNGSGGIKTVQRSRNYKRFLCCNKSACVRACVCVRGRVSGRLLLKY